MSNTIIELIRSKHEELEHLEKALTKAFNYRDNNPTERVTAEFIIKKFIEDIQKISQDIINLQLDKGGIKKEEVDIYAGKKNYYDSNLSLLTQHTQPTRAPDVWYNFYEKVKELKQINKRTMSTYDVNENLNSEKLFNMALDEVNNKQIFTAEENKGKCVDMHPIYLDFLNFKKLRESKVLNVPDYLYFLSEFNKFELVPLSIKKSGRYKEYITSILNYLKNFFIKTNPLIEFNDVQDAIDTQFEKEWNEGTLAGWENVIASLRGKETTDGVSKDKLFCVPCGRKFAKETVFNHHLNSKPHLKKVSEYNNLADNVNKIIEEIDMNEEEKSREVAYYEFQILRYKDLLHEVIENTKNHIRKKQSMSPDELEADLVIENELNTKAIDEDDEDNKPIYNPKHIPIGWDGKPIPYWLYKIHGLGIEYKCEICGGASYWGRKAFERHFQEWRHAYGMRCLKIANTVHFKEVTGIEEALRLHQYLIEKEKKEKFKPEFEEEFEDTEGNVVNKKMFVDLRRQGLL